MARLSEIYQFLTEVAPLDLAAKWDNVGLLVDAGQDTRGVLFALDITPAVVHEAAARNCRLIVSHHPVIFTPMHSVAPDDVVFQLIAKGISAICMHTNLDAAVGGVNDHLAMMLDMRDTVPFAEGCGRIGTVDPLSTAQLCMRCTDLLEAQVQYVDAKKPITRLAVVSGSGGSYVAEAAALGADALLTGEAGHHHAHDAARLGITLLAAGHYATEFPIVSALAQQVAEAFPLLDCYVSKEDVDPFTQWDASNK